MPSEQILERLKRAEAYERKAAERLQPPRTAYSGPTKTETRALEAQAYATLALSLRTAIQTEAQFEGGRTHG
jgi:hypothetical protein